MKIAYYSSIYFTDCDFSLIREMQKRGIEVTYYIQIVKGRQCGGLLDLRSYDFPIGIIQAGNIPEFKIYSGYLDLSNTYLVVRSRKLNDYRNWKTYYLLTNKIRSLNPDWVHITNALGVSECFLYVYFRKMVMTVHDPFMHSGEYKKTSECKRKIAFHLVSKLILLNKNQYNLFISTYGINTKKVHLSRLSVYDSLSYLVKNYIDYKKYTNDYILFFGHFSPYKGIDILCKAMIKVHQYYPNVRCIIAGNGNLSFDFKPFENCPYIVLKNHFIETLELVELINNSMFIVCPYKDATQSGVVASSFALSKPVLASNVGGLNETVINGQTGILVQPDNIEELAEAIIFLLKNRNKLSEMSENIKYLFKHGNYSWESIVNGYLDIYTQKVLND